MDILFEIIVDLGQFILQLVQDFLLIAIFLIGLAVIFIFRKPLGRIIKSLLSKIFRILKVLYWETGKILYPELKEYKQAGNLALKLETRIRNLNELPVSDQNSPISLVDILKTAILLLDRFIEVREHQKNSQQLTNPPSPTTQQPQIIPQQKQENMKISLEIPAEPKLSETAKELIKLRDSVLLAKTGNNTANSEILEVIYEDLGRILEKEGVTTLEETGKFDYEQQQVVSTQLTDDPEKDEMVCETVRPGYLFAGNILRPQEVIIYTFKQ